MNGLSEIAATGAPGIMTVVGLGTVFLCLTLLYGCTRLLGILLAPKSAKPPAAAQVASTAAEPEPEAGASEDSGAGEAALAAAITLVLARHRASVLRSHDEDPTGDPWKMAGRLRMLRS